MDQMDIKLDDLEDKPKKIGTLEGNPVFQIQTKGGFNVIAAQKGAQFKIIGAASHQAIARHIAQKKEPTLVYESLQKSEAYPLYAFKDLIASYEDLTDQLNTAFNK
jgi:hypothetical protein